MELDLEPYQAALLLYAGIASRQGLAAASPQQLLTQLGQQAIPHRNGSSRTPTLVRAWIQRAQDAGRSKNCPGLVRCSAGDLK